MDTIPGEISNQPPTKQGWKKINRTRRHYKNIGLTMTIHHSKQCGLYLVQKIEYEQKINYNKKTKQISLWNN